MTTRVPAAPKLSERQQFALTFLRDHADRSAGEGWCGCPVRRPGETHAVLVLTATMWALEARGLAETRCAPGQGVAARITPEGRAWLVRMAS